MLVSTASDVTAGGEEPKTDVCYVYYTACLKVDSSEVKNSDEPKAMDSDYESTVEFCMGIQ